MSALTITDIPADTEDDFIEPSLITAGGEIKFNDKWELYYHHILNVWKKEGYQKIYVFDTAKSFWRLMNNIQFIGGLLNVNYYMTRSGIAPNYEDPENRGGGCWAIKLMSSGEMELSAMAHKVWVDLAARIVGETLLHKTGDDADYYDKALNGMVTALTIDRKGTNAAVIQIWNKDRRLTDTSLLPKSAFEFCPHIIYIPHPEPEF